ncbi:hypothetical protein ZWY2020_004958 [Hordeum vulgare]|nr:hypothetical protein ZWY2020_004958 [Hordeum vulgare]
MSTSEGSETADSMDEDMSQVPHGRRSKVWEHYEQELVVVEGDPRPSLRTHIAKACRSIEDACRKRFLLTMKKSHPKACSCLMKKLVVN